MPNSPLNVKEEKIERYLCERVKENGGVAEKVTVIGVRGFFDRVVILPGGIVLWVEVKKPKGSRMAAHQRERHKRYEALGAHVAVIKTLADVDRLVDHDGRGGIDKKELPRPPGQAPKP